MLSAIDDDWPDSEDTDGDNDFAHIQPAIDAASNEDVITVSQGTYYENINFKGKGITLTSTDSNNPDIVAATIIDGNEVDTVVIFISGEDSTSILSGCTIQNGSATFGGGIFCTGSSPAITNCTISGNSARTGGGIFCSSSSSSPTITNCISWNNSPNEIASFGNSTPIITYSNIQGDYTGEGNSDEDPLFVNSESGDYHLQPDSPCIDIGDPDSTITEDKDGISRPQDGNNDSIAICDMGAYEYFNKLIADLDKDGDVDSNDLRIFATCFGYVQLLL